MLAVVYTSHELDSLLARALPLHVSLSVVALPDGTFAPAGLRFDHGRVLTLEDWPCSFPTSSEALQVGLREAKRRMRGRWLFRPGERFSKS